MTPSEARSRAFSVGIVAAAAAILISTTRIESPRACSCMPTTKAEQLERSQAVFLGEVRSFGPLGGGCRGGASAPGMRVARLRVTRTWKGDVRAGQEVAVTTADNSAACGFEFQTGKSYMVYAVPDEDGRTLSTSLCTTTREVPGGVADPDTLGTPLD